MDSILEEVRENIRKRDSCQKHSFKKLDVYSLGRKLECIHCSTKMYLSDAYTYIRGYKAAGGNPKDIFEDYEDTK